MYHVGHSVMPLRITKPESGLLQTNAEFGAFADASAGSDILEHATADGVSLWSRDSPSKRVTGRTLSDVAEPYVD